MDNIQKLNELIDAVINNKPNGLDVVIEKRSRTTAVRSGDVIPAVPYPKLQLTNDWGQNATEGFDVQLFRLAGLGEGSTIQDRLSRLYTLVDCEADCPTRVQEVIARLSVMEIFSSLMHDSSDSAKGFLFENFLALCLRGTVVGGRQIQDLEIMTSNTTEVSHSVSLKLIKEDTPIRGSIRNLYNAVVESGKSITYVIGYKRSKKVEIRSLIVDTEFFQNQVIGGGRTLQQVYDDYLIKDSKSSSQFYINKGPALGLSNELGFIPVYSYKQMKTKAEQLTAALNTPVTEIYENLNLFSQQLTDFYLSNDARNGQKARVTFDRLVAAVNQEEKLKQST